ncbi:MAG: hypothetical protein HY929_06810 [Euryarchaeota archaeon]|nr:hypothetical protein [Euryarchaeota archaeon]
MAVALGKVGSKGELFPPKEIKEEAEFKPGDMVVFKAEKGKIEVIKVPTIKEAFNQKSFAKISFKEFEEMTEEVIGP